MIKNIKKTLGISFLLVVFAASAIAAEYYVDKSKKENLVKFTSKMQIEDFDGTTSKIDGYFKHGEKLEGGEVYFEVDLNSVTTGMGLRDRHMRDNYLHTAKYPKTSYKGTISQVTDKGSYYEVVIDGNMNLHGVYKAKQVKGTLTKGENSLRVKTNFWVKLPDYKIEIPQLMFAKINENIELNLDFFLKKVK